VMVSIGSGRWLPFIEGAVGCLGWWLLVHCHVGVIPGHVRVVVLGCCRHRVVVGLWPGVVFHHRVVSVAVWSVAIVLHCLVVHHGHSP